MAEETPIPVSIVIRSADPSEGELLREIAFRSKAHWGYEAATVREWVAGGDFSPRRLRELTVFVAEDEARPVGWCSVIEKGETWWLEDLWIEPAWIGKEIGARLFRHAVAHVKSLGARRLELEAEPNSVGFYERMGARYLRDSEPSSWGRTIPIMGVDLDG